MTDQLKRQFGGKQEGAGRKKLPPEKVPTRRVLYLPPDLDGKLRDAVGDRRGAVTGEIARIVRLYFDTPQIIE